MIHQKIEKILKEKNLSFRWTDGNYDSKKEIKGTRF